MKRYLFLIAVMIVSLLMVTGPALAQDEEMCVTVDGHEVCGTAEDVVAVLQALGESSDGDEDADGVTTEDNDFDVDFEVSWPEGGDFASVSPDWMAGDGNEQECTLPEQVCNILAEPGVLGVDDRADAVNNPSATWTGSANHMILENTTGSVLLPGWGYATGFAASWHIEGAGYEFDFPACEDCIWGFVIRGDVDGNPIELELSDYGAAGAAIVTRYPVGEHDGAAFSEDYFVDQAENALVFDNCRADGCQVFLAAIIDINDGALTILRTEDAQEWDVVYSNVEVD